MRKPSRRAFLAAAGATGLGATAGCLGFLETERATREPPLPENRPDAAYVPSHVEGMEMPGMQTSGRYACALSYTFPHRFWLVRGTDTDRVDVRGEDDVHLMVAVWDTETGTVLPEANVAIEHTGPDGETSSVTPWQMLSQQMGVHHGDNVALGPEGNYDVTVRVVPPTTRRTGESAATDPVEFGFSFTFDRSSLDDLPFEDIPADREGSEGAVDPMDMKSATLSQAPTEDAFPIPVRGTGETGGANLVVGTADRLGSLATGDGETYVATSLRTPHNRFVLPNASLSATVDAGGERVFDGDLVPTLDADLGYHYGAVVSASDAIENVTVSVDTPPQVSRHEGYETAFFDFSDVSV
ncbi:iron transporter [Halobacterium sp. KA-6]|uniref:iron transporter n=1 Tax=Halobacterium sp. KA-6 TaxID=2896368 RepID=UPI001E6066A9|nr:iron transporter [Halobacterium sp. KA-6]MCD2202372.1 iron transporter [Halobacterium sp. KA-6]